MRSQVLRLYKDLLRYGQNLQFTDKKYFKYRVKKGFVNNKHLEDTKTIQFYIEVKEQSPIYLIYGFESHYS